MKNYFAILFSLLAIPVFAAMPMKSDDTVFQVVADLQKSTAAIHDVVGDRIYSRFRPMVDEAFAGNPAGFGFDQMKFFAVNFDINPLTALSGNPKIYLSVMLEIDCPSEKLRTAIPEEPLARPDFLDENIFHVDDMIVDIVGENVVIFTTSEAILDKYADLYAQGGSETEILPGDICARWEVTSLSKQIERFGLKPFLFAFLAKVQDPELCEIICSLNEIVVDFRSAGGKAGIDLTVYTDNAEAREIIHNFFGTLAFSHRVGIDILGSLNKGKLRGIFGNKTACEEFLRLVPHLNHLLSTERGANYERLSARADLKAAIGDSLENALFGQDREEGNEDRRERRRARRKNRK